MRQKSVFRAPNVNIFPALCPLPDPSPLGEFTPSIFPQVPFAGR